MSITRIHWSQVPSAHGPLQTAEPAWALWPDPVDHDLCFAEAGFKGFADSDEQWDADFSMLIDDLMTCLSRVGDPVLLSGIQPVQKIGWLRKKTASLQESIEYAATTDGLPPCCVGFGQPPGAQLIASDGHPLFWLYLRPPLIFQEVLESVAGDRKVMETDLDWSILTPRVPSRHR